MKFIIAVVCGRPLAWASMAAPNSSFAAFLRKRAEFAREVVEKRRAAKEYLVFLARREAKRQAAREYLRAQAIRACAVCDARKRAAAYLRQRSEHAVIVVQKQQSARAYLVALATEASRTARKNGEIWDIILPYDDDEPDRLAEHVAHALADRESERAAHVTGNSAASDESRDVVP